MFVEVVKIVLVCVNIFGEFRIMLMVWVFYEFENNLNMLMILLLKNLVCESWFKWLV